MNGFFNPERIAVLREKAKDTPIILSMLNEIERLQDQNGELTTSLERLEGAMGSACSSLARCSEREAKSALAELRKALASLPI